MLRSAVANAGERVSATSIALEDQGRDREAEPPAIPDRELGVAGGEEACRIQPIEAGRFDGGKGNPASSRQIERDERGAEQRALREAEEARERREKEAAVEERLAPVGAIEEEGAERAAREEQRRDDGDASRGRGSADEHGVDEEEEREREDAEVRDVMVARSVLRAAERRDRGAVRPSRRRARGATRAR